jgi:small subunit ribosomal protein S8e
MPIHKKKRSFEKARQPSMTKLGAKRIHVVRCRGGNLKYRALRLDSGNFSWGSEAVTRKARILDVNYNATSNELVRTKTLMKNTVIQIDATPFKAWYMTHYGVDLGKKKEGEEPAPVQQSRSVLKKIEARSAA